MNATLSPDKLECYRQGLYSLEDVKADPELSAYHQERMKRKVYATGVTTYYCHECKQKADFSHLGSHK